MSDRIISPKQVAETLGICVTTLYRMWERGDGPRRLRISPNRVGVRVSDLDAFIEQRASHALPNRENWEAKRG